MMQRSIISSRAHQAGFSILEMLLATVILLVGLVAIAQLVPASILLNYRNRTDSSALVFAQRELDFMIGQPLILTNFTDLNRVYCPGGSTCNLGTPAPANQVQGSPVGVFNSQTMIDFTNPSGVPNWSFTYQHPNDPSGPTDDIRWSLIVTGNNG